MKYTREFIGNLLSQLRNNYYKKKKTSIKIFDDCVIKLTHEIVVNREISSCCTLSPTKINQKTG